MGVTEAIVHCMDPAYAGFDGLATEMAGPNGWLALAAKMVVDADPDAHAPTKTTAGLSVPFTQLR